MNGAPSRKCDSAFTEDELIYADYRRPTEAHPTQRSYDVRMNRGRINDRHGVPAVGREFTAAELDAAIRRVLAAYPNECAIAVSLARRIRPLMAPLVASRGEGWDEPEELASATFSGARCRGRSEFVTTWSDPSLGALGRALFRARFEVDG